MPGPTPLPRQVHHRQSHHPPYLLHHLLLLRQLPRWQACQDRPHRLLCHLPHHHPLPSSLYDLLLRRSPHPPCLDPSIQAPPPSPASPNNPPPKELAALVSTCAPTFSYRFSRVTSALNLLRSLFVGDNRKVTSVLRCCPHLLNNDPSSPVWLHLSPCFLSSLMCAIRYSNPPEAPPTASPEFRSFITYCL